MLDETDRLFHCAYCRVSSYLTTAGVFRYLLPNHAPEGRQIVYFPYWRFKGMLFSCLTSGIDKRFVDVSHQALPSLHFPVSVGLRSQTQKLRFADSVENAVFVKPKTSVKGMLALVNERFSAKLPKPILHQDHIGETLSLLYAPYYITDKIYDAILNEPVASGLPTSFEPSSLVLETPRWPIRFIPTLCPACGWDLAGGKDALALSCTNCDTVWAPKGGRFRQLNAAHGRPDGITGAAYLPFWRIKAEVSGLSLATYADAVKVANLPKVVQPGWDRIPFYFWCPAFKVRPQNFLTIAGKVTFSLPPRDLAKGLPQGNPFPVNLPLSEAVQALKLMLAGFMRPRQQMIRRIADIKVTAKSFLLVYLPFEQGPHEYIQPRLNLAINRNQLAHSGNL